MQVHINKESEQLIIPYYYMDRTHKELPYKEGLYGILPAGSVQNCYSDNRWCGDWMEWAYNNPYQPVAEYDEKLKKRMPFLDGSHANAVRNLGSLKSVWKEFEHYYGFFTVTPDDFDINELEEDFWQYYISRYSHKFKRAVSVLEEYVRNARTKMTDKDRAIERISAPFFSDDEVWMRGCRDYLRHLVYTTPRGYMMELILFAAICQVTDGLYEESTIQDERNGIDGYIVFDDKKVPISLKPSTYTAQYASPLDTTCFVIYRKRKESYPHLIFEFQTGFETLELHTTHL